MRKLIWISLVMALISCDNLNMNNSTKKEKEENFVPETPKLTSDIMTPEVLWSFGRVGNAAVSPDGKTVLYTVTYFNIEKNKSYRDIYSVSINGGEAHQLTNTVEREHSVVWRPDGKKIGYLSSKSGSSQIWEMNPDGTGNKKISDVEGGINGFLYAPDLSKIVYTKSVKLDKNIVDRHTDLPKANARIETDLMYRHWGSWHDYTYNHLFVAKYKKGKLMEGKDIMEGERYDAPMKPFGGMEQVAISPDGKKVAYSCKKKTGKDYAFSTNSDIYLYDTKTGETMNFTSGMMGYDQNPVFSPDGTKLAWESMARDGYEADKNRLFVGNLLNGEKTDHSAEFDQNSNGLQWSKDGNAIYFISDIEATDEIFKLDLVTNEIKRVTEGIHNYQNVAIAGDKLVAQRVSMSSPAEIFTVNEVSGKAEQITQVNKGILDQLNFGKVESRWITTTDGKKMKTWVIYPPNFDPNKKYPALLYCQGGPQSTVSQFWSYRWNFQMMAANDYIIVAPNRRGLPGFGQEWLEQISTDYGGQNIQDLLSAIDEVKKEPYVDENRLGAVGASYGGFSVYYLAGNHDKRFKAFIAHDGIFNFEHMYATTEEMWFVDWDQGGAPWDKTNAVAQRSKTFSPHNFVEMWDTPIMVIHGEKDFRVPPEQGLAAFNTAIMQDVPAKLLYFPDENHWVLQAQNGILWQREFFSWLDKWLKDDQDKK